MNPTIPAQAQAIFGPDQNGDFGGVPWGSAQAQSFDLEGLTGDVILFPTDGAYQGVLFVSGANIDTDGPGGSTAEDPDWQSETSLTSSDGTSCNSHRFPGVVIPPQLKNFGVRIGDFGLACFNGQALAFQVYDQGPSDKIGELSIYFGRQLGIVPPNVSDHDAARGRFPSVSDLVTLIFPGSGPHHAIDTDLIQDSALHFWQPFSGR